jgi:hypothetical protein
MKNKMGKTEIYRKWELFKTASGLYICQYAFGSTLEQFKTKPILGNSKYIVKSKIDKHIKRWGW